MSDSEPTPWEPEELSPKSQRAFEQLSYFAEKRKEELNKQVHDLMYPGLVQRARSVFTTARLRGDTEVAKEWATIGVALALTDKNVDYSEYD